MKPENVLLCVDDRHVRLLAREAVEWERMGKNPDESAVGVGDLSIRDRSSLPSTRQHNLVRKSSSAALIGAGAIYDAEQKKLTQNQKKKLKKKQKKQAAGSSTTTGSQKNGADEGENGGEDENDDECENSAADSADSVEKARTEGLAKLLKLIDEDIDIDADAVDGDRKKDESGASNGSSRRKSDSANKKSASELIQELKNKQLDSIFKVVDEKQLQVESLFLNIKFLIESRHHITFNFLFTRQRIF